MVFYVASGLENAGVARAFAEMLVRLGYRWSYDWTAHGAVAWAGDERVREVSLCEMGGVAASDVVVVILPGGRGTHVEMGAAIAMNKRVILYVPPDERQRFLGENVCAFYRHPAVEIVEGSFADLLAVIQRPRPLSSLHLYAPDGITSIEVDGPTVEGVEVTVYAVGSAMMVARNTYFGFTLDAQRSAERWFKMAMTLGPRKG